MDLQRPGAGVDLWRMRAAAGRFPAAAQRSVLSPDECERAGRFRFERDRALFSVSHMGKRLILARYLGVPPREIAFQSGGRGKPFLASGALQFNLSHSRGVVLMAVQWGGELGADVEAVQTAARMAPIFNRFASAAEKADFAGELRRGGSGLGRRLTAWWAGKEAFVKAVGRGLSLPFARFSIGWDAFGGWRLAEAGAEFGAASDWSLRLFLVGSDQLGALATRRLAPRIRAFCGEGLFDAGF